MSTSKGLHWANGMDMSWDDDGGIESWFGDRVSCGSQVLSNSSEFPRSEIGLEIVIHSGGMFAPQKVSFSKMTMYNIPFQLI